MVSIKEKEGMLWVQWDAIEGSWEPAQRMNAKIGRKIKSIQLLLQWLMTLF